MPSQTAPASPTASKPASTNGSAHGAASGGSAQSSTLGEQLLRSPAIDGAVRQIVGEVRAKASQLADARPPNAALKESYEQFMKRAADVRGRALLYPYLGSGVGNGPLVELMDGSVKWDMITVGSPGTELEFAL